MHQLAFDLGQPACAACGSDCGRPTVSAAGKPGTLVVWHADDPGPFGPPGPGRRHPVDEMLPGRDLWPCPHCANGPYGHRDTCERNDVHPPDCRCAWCTYGLTWDSCPRSDCGRGAHTVGPHRLEVVVCRAHGEQRVPQAVVAKLDLLTSAPQSTSLDVGVA